MNRYVLLLLTFLCSQIWGMEDRSSIFIPFSIDAKDRGQILISFFVTADKVSLHCIDLTTSVEEKFDNLLRIKNKSFKLMHKNNEIDYYFVNLNEKDVKSFIENYQKQTASDSDMIQVPLEELLNNFYSKIYTVIYNSNKISVARTVSSALRTKKYDDWYQSLVHFVNNIFLLPSSLDNGNMFYYFNKNNKENTYFLQKTLTTNNLLDTLSEGTNLHKQFLSRHKEFTITDEQFEYVDYTNDRLHIFKITKPADGYTPINAVDLQNAVKQKNPSINNVKIDSRLVPLLKTYFSQKGTSPQSTAQKGQKESAAARYIFYFKNPTDEIIVVLKIHNDKKGNATYTNFGKTDLSNFTVTEKSIDLGSGVIFQEINAIAPNANYVLTKLDNFKTLVENHDKKLYYRFQNDMDNLLKSGFKFDDLKKSKSASLQLSGVKNQASSQVSSLPIQQDQSAQQLQRYIVCYKKDDGEEFVLLESERSEGFNNVYLYDDFSATDYNIFKGCNPISEKTVENITVIWIKADCVNQVKSPKYLVHVRLQDFLDKKKRTFEFTNSNNPKQKGHLASPLQERIVDLLSIDEKAFLIETKSLQPQQLPQVPAVDQNNPQKFVPVKLQSDVVPLRPGGSISIVPPQQPSIVWEGIKWFFSTINPFFWGPLLFNWISNLF